MATRPMTVVLKGLDQTYLRPETLKSLTNCEGIVVGLRGKYVDLEINGKAGERLTKKFLKDHGIVYRKYINLD